MDLEVKFPLNILMPLMPFKGLKNLRFAESLTWDQNLKYISTVPGLLQVQFSLVHVLVSIQISLALSFQYFSR